MINRVAKRRRIPRRVILTGLVIVVTGLSFWSTSRYPQLDEKATMGGDANLEDPLSFDAYVELQASDTTVERIAYTTINWFHTNQNGMIFGLVIGASMLTLLGRIRTRGHSNGFMNTVLGMVIGAPLGVCVNCAAPVAKGMHDAGARLETTLAAMFSSPTLNIVVLTMLFSIFPLYFALIKLGLTLGFILLLIPLLTRYVFKNERLPTYDDATCAISPPDVMDSDEGWRAAARGTAADLARNLWYLVRKTIPLMALAGFLGAAMVTLLPLESFVDVQISLWSLLLVSFFGLLLPVPVAFDIVVAASLLIAGVPVVYVMVLLFVLGIYSIYPFFIVSTTISLRVASVLALVLTILGVAGGEIADRIHQRSIDEMMNIFEVQETDLTR